MNRIDALFKRKHRDILSVYFPAGYPDLNSTMEILSELEMQNIDLVEIGMPFSDPLADGPVIQHASKVALENGMSVSILFDQLIRSRTKNQDSRLPVVLMGYLNPVLQFGMEKFLDHCVQNSVSGVILPDLPVEVYEEEYQAMFEKSGVYFIFLVTPRTSEERLKKIASLSRGFIYLVSTSSTTGRKDGFTQEQLDGMKRVREIIPGTPILTGFGIHDAETREAASRYSNGVVVGTAFMRELERKDTVSAVKALLDGLSACETSTEVVNF